jgi:hypothetical protein
LKVSGNYSNESSSILEKIKSRCKSGNASYYSVLNHSSSSLLFSLHGYFILREIFWLRVIENRVLRRIFGPKRDEVTGEWSFMVCVPYQMLFE